MLGRAAEKVEERRLKCVKITKVLEKSEADRQKAEQEVTQTERRLESILLHNEPLHQELAEISVQTKASMVAKRELKKKQELLNEEYMRKKSELSDLQRRIDNEARKGSDGERRQRLIEERKVLQKACKDIARKERDARDKAEDFDTQITALSEELKAVNLRREDKQTRLAQIDALLNQLRASKANRLNAYGTNVPKLLELIKQHKGWKKKPVGPVGTHLKLKNPKFGPLLESVIGNTLSAFCVTNQQDRAQLENMRRRTECTQIPILMGSDEAFDWSAGEPNERITTILRVIDFDDDFVKRQLINNMHIERCAIVARREDGDALMRSNCANVRICFTLDLFRVEGGNTGSHSQTITQYQGAPRLSSDVDVQILESQNRYNQVEEELQRALADTKSLEDRKKRMEQEQKRIKVRSRFAS